MTSLNLRLPDDLHAEAVKEAEAGRLSLNSAICEAVTAWVADRKQQRRESEILDRVMTEHADTIALIRAVE